MMRTKTLIAAVCAALLLASCGKDEGDPISQKRADRLDSLLQQVQRQSDAHSCTTLLNDTLPALEKEAGRLPEKVGSDTRETIEDGIGHLRELAETDCTERQEEELPTTTQTTPSTTTTETPTTTTTEPPTTTETEPSTSTETTPTDPEPPTDTGPADPTTPDQGNGGTPTPKPKKSKKDKSK